MNGTIMQIVFYKKYALFSVLLFSVELAIAMFIHDAFIRPFLGDVLVVMLLFCLCKTFVKVSDQWLIVAVLLFSFVVEIGQYFRLAELLGLMDCKVIRIAIGSTFDVKDLLAYAIGAALLSVITKFRRRCVV